MVRLPEFELIRPGNLDEVLAARRAHPGSRVIGGGTDLLVNMRRGLGGGPPALISMADVAELKTIDVDAKSARIGASVTVEEVAVDGAIKAHYPVIAEAAALSGGPTHRHMGTVGGNLCLETRCVYYNQSEWWRAANGHCFKDQGSGCHVALKSKSCFATFSGDLAPAVMIHDGEVEIIGSGGRRTLPVADLYSGDGCRHLTLAEDEIVIAVRLNNRKGLRSAYEKVRVRRSIDFPLAGVAVGLCREGRKLTELRVAVTGTNPRPVLLAGTGDLVGGPLDGAVLEALEKLMRDQIMSMKTTLTPGHYRRRLAIVMAKRLVERLFHAGGSGG
ncbi:MAG: 4-hydroxybenzoyl-CoA reductase subunit beta [Sphingomonadales bacterium]